MINQRFKVLSGATLTLIGDKIQQDIVLHIDARCNTGLQILQSIQYYRQILAY